MNDLGRNILQNLIKTPNSVALPLFFGLSLNPFIGLNESFAISLVPRQSVLQRAAQRTEADFCTDGCATRAPQSSFPGFLSRIPTSGPERLYNATIFDRDKRQTIMDLRKRNPRTLSPEEKAVLTASTRTGSIMCGDIPVSSNGTLIQLADGRDAVITSAHAFVDNTGRPKCDLSNIEYMPNVNLYIGEWTETVLKVTKTDGRPPLNLENTLSGDFTSSSRLKDDFLVFVLSDDISRDRLPDGSTRGFMKMASQVPRTGKTYLVGINPDYRNGDSAGFESCKYGNTGLEYYHLCAATVNSSSSALTILENDELVLSGIHNGEITSQSGKTVPMPKRIEGGNIGLSIDTLRRYLERRSKPAVTSDGLSI